MQVEALGQNAIPTGIVAIPDQIPAISERRPLRFITCGSVDDGKSTLIGRLLWDTKSVSEDLADGLQRSPDQIDGDGLHLPEFAMLLDGLQAERQQGITIDVAYRYFATPETRLHRRGHPGTCAIYPQHGHRCLHCRTGDFTGGCSIRIAGANPQTRHDCIDHGDQTTGISGQQDRSGRL